MEVQATQAELDNLHRLLAMAHDEDLGTGDLTSRLLPAEVRATGKFIAREPMVACGVGFLPDVARAYDELIETVQVSEDGQYHEPGDVLAEWQGPAWAIMAAERVALNFLQRLSGIATLTRRYVNTIRGTGADVLDTRKTTPGWRFLEKYAVRVGGGKNHRLGLYDGVMVKDNHLVALSKVHGEMTLRSLGPRLEELRGSMEGEGFIEVEVDRADQLADALDLPVDAILLDNMRPEQLRRAVLMRDEAGKKGVIELEASGGITLETIRAVAETGVERISVGSLTHSPKAADIALDLAL